MEKELPISTYIVKYFCDSCETGEVIFHNPHINPLLPPPTKFEHFCDRCKMSYNLPVQYPHLRYDFGVRH